MDKLLIEGQKVIAEAVYWWKQDIYDPTRSDASVSATASKKFITGFIKHGLDWTWEPDYAGDGTFEWCGAFAAECWSKIKPELRKTYFASTYRLDRYASYQSSFGEKNAGAGRLYAQLDEHSKTLPFAPREGDILLIGPKGYGQHICLVESFDEKARVFHTIEGNGNGAGPRGERQQGVVKGVRALGAAHVGDWCARRLIRPSVDDLA